MTLKTSCPKCGRVWTEQNDLLDLLNHPEVHRWLENDCKVTTNWSIRQSYLTPSEQKTAMMDWAMGEAINICQAMSLPIPETLVYLIKRRKNGYTYA